MRRHDASVRWFTTLVFACVYLGLAAGRIPGLGLDRAGIALLGAIALLAAGALGTAQAWAAIDAPTLILLFGLMAVSAQLWSSGFYAAITRRLSVLDASPQRLLAWLIAVSASLASVLMNDVVCLAMANAQTANLINVGAFARMKPTAYFINASRGELVDEAALRDALDQGRLAGCALDVGRAPDQMPTPSLAAHPRVLATPHLGGLTGPAITHQALETVEQVAALLQGRLPAGCVNGEHARRLRAFAERGQSAGSGNSSSSGA